MRSLTDDWRVSERRASVLVGLSRKAVRYRPKERKDSELKKRLLELAQKHPRNGSPKLYQRLRMEGFEVNHKRVERIYREERLSLRRKRRRRLSVVKRVMPQASVPNQCWAIDFIFDRVFGGRTLKMLTVIDEATRESPMIGVGYSCTGRSLTELLSKLPELPRSLRMDNGPEFRSAKFQRWCQERNIEVLYTQPGKPTQNAFVESFNGKFRDECLNQELFFGLEDAKQKVERWRMEYNTERPHQSLGGIPPSEYRARRWSETEDVLLTGTYAA